MLRFVEAVNLIEEEEDAFGRRVGFGRGEEAELAALGCGSPFDRVDNAPQFRLAGRDCREIVKGLLGDISDHARQGGLANAGRTPEDHAGHGSLLQRAVQRFALANEMRLADEATEVARADSFSERLGRLLHGRAFALIVGPASHAPNDLHDLMQVIEVVVGAEYELVIERKAAPLSGTSWSLPDLLIFGQR